MTDTATQMLSDDLALAESELERKEQWLTAEVERVRTLRRDVTERITKAKSAAEDVQLKSTLGALNVPSLNVRTSLDEGRLARLKAIAIRKGCFERARDDVHAHEAALDGLTKRVRDEEAAAKARVVQKPAPPPAAARPKPVPAPQPAESSLLESLHKALESKPVAPDERRHAQRARLCTEISLGSDSNLFTGFTNDVSAGGVFVATLELMPIGTHVDVAFNLPGGQHIEGRGEVRWLREHDDRNPEAFPGMGIQFVDLPLTAVGAIQQFAAEREPMFFPD
jgi:uncharacterized protein (TIGR02266 family)